MWDDKIHPVPEIISPGLFEVRELPRGGHTSRASRVFAAPFANTPFGRAIRAHEYLHLKLSPDAPDAARHRVSEETLLAVEDARINEGGARFGFDDLLLTLDDPSIAAPHPSIDLRGAVLFLIASHRTGTYARTLSWLLDCGDAGRMACHLAGLALRKLEAPDSLPGFETTLEIARMLDRRFGTPPAAPGGKRKGHVCGIAAIVGTDEPGAARGERVGRGTLIAGAWGALRRVDEPPRTIDCPGARSRRRSRATDEGDVLRFPHRLLVDRRVFARRRRLPGGSVLIDASGSMHLTPKGLLALVEAAAGALVACYDGAREGFGEIRVLARAGRRVADRLVAPPTGRGGNVIDGPALRWLADRPAPRIWVSDGVVTGIGDAGSPALSAEALEICRRASIARAADVVAASRLLGSEATRRAVSRSS